jgi:hypothetical protein
MIQAEQCLDLRMRRMTEKTNKARAIGTVIGIVVLGIAVLWKRLSRSMGLCLEALTQQRCHWRTRGPSTSRPIRFAKRPLRSG